MPYDFTCQRENRKQAKAAMRYLNCDLNLKFYFVHVMHFNLISLILEEKEKWSLLKQELECWFAGR